MSLDLLDVLVILAYFVLVLASGFWANRAVGLRTYLINDGSTSTLLLTCATVSTIVGAGAIVGTASAAHSSGISYGISSLLAILGNLLIFLWLMPRIREQARASNCYTTGEFLCRRFSRTPAAIFSVVYTLVAAIWTAVQFLALANLMTVMLGISLGMSLLLAALVSISYSTFGGTRSDILTDFVQFWIMLVTFLVLVPAVFTQSGGFPALQALPAGHFDPLAFGGLPLMIGSIIIGGLYPLGNVYDWLRMNSAESTAACRKAYLISIPLIALFMLSAVLLGLCARLLVPDIAADQSLFQVMNRNLPVGLRGLALASIMAVVMSSVDSIMISASATLVSRVWRKEEGTVQRSDQQKLFRLRLVLIVFGLSCVAIAWLIPSIVNLSLTAAFVSLCFGPAILAGLISERTTSKGATISLILALLGLALAYPFLGTSSFVVSIILGVPPLLIFKSRVDRP